MAALTATERATLRRALAAEAVTVTWNKAQVDAALQAIEDWADANQASLSTAINAATQPLGITLTAPQKARLFVHWCLSRHARNL